MKSPTPAAQTNGGHRSPRAAHPRPTRITAHQAFALSLLTLAVLLAGCRSAQQTPVRNPSAVAGEEANWFCETGDESREWGCVENQELVRTAPVAGPRDRSERTHTDPGRASAQRSPTLPPEARAPQPPASDVAAPRDVALQPGTPTPLTEVPPDYYVVQLVAVQTKEALEDYAARQDLQGMSAARVERDGRLFYVLLLSVYPDRERARTAASNLPAEFAEFDPWVRSVDSLQQAMRRADALAGTTEI